MDMIDWQLLNAIPIKKSMAKVADALFLSEPAILYRINRMEKEFNQTLFIRNNKGISLTSAGLRLQSFANTMLQYETYIRNKVNQKNSEISGMIAIGTTSNFLNYNLAPQINEFLSQYPMIELQVYTHSSDVLLDEIKKGSLMLAIVRGKPDWNGSCIEIVNDPLIIVSAEPITENLLHQKPLIRGSGNSSFTNITNLWIQEYFVDTPPKSSPIKIYGDSMNIISFVKSGMGWAIISASRLNPYDHLYSEPLRHKDGSLYTYNSYLIYSKECEIFDTYQIYMDHVIHYFASNQIRKK